MISAARKNSEMDEPKQENSPIGESSEEKSSATEESVDIAEMNQPGWSVVSFEGVAVSNLTYTEAREWIEKLDRQKISGLCIVTDEAAARLINN